MIDPEKLSQASEAVANHITQKQLEAARRIQAERAAHTPQDVYYPAPNVKLDDMNLEVELVRQYNRVLRLQEDVIGDFDTPANQKAQVAGQVASTLQSLIKCQVELKRDERLKQIEAALLESIATLPEEVKDAFFARYEEIAAAKGVSL